MAGWRSPTRGGSTARSSPRRRGCALGDAAVAVTAVSDSLADGELEEAEALARQIGIRHRVIRTEEFADPNYLRNNPDRCYFCKSELYGRLAGLLGELGVDVIASGANADDAGDHRPGMRAAGENGVRHPLQECGLGKDDVRALARAWGLPTWDKPATPCLSSRIAYGEEVTPERVRMIDQAEQWLRGPGLRLLRVRYHKGDLARIEVPLDELPRLADPEVRERAGRGVPRARLQVRHARPGRVPLRQPQRADPPVESLQRPAAPKASMIWSRERPMLRCSPCLYLVSSPSRISRRSRIHAPGDLPLRPNPEPALPRVRTGSSARNAGARIRVRRDRRAGATDGFIRFLCACGRRLKVRVGADEIPPTLACVPTAAGSSRSPPPRRDLGSSQTAGAARRETPNDETEPRPTCRLERWAAGHRKPKPRRPDRAGDSDPSETHHDSPGAGRHPAGTDPAGASRLCPRPRPARR